MAIVAIEDLARMLQPGTRLMGLDVGECVVKSGCEIARIVRVRHDAL